MNKKSKRKLIVVLFVILILLIILLYYLNVRLNYNEYQLKGQVTTSGPTIVGNLSTMDFGGGRKGMISIKKTNVTNIFEIPIIFSVKITGNITPLIDFAYNKTPLMPGESTEITYKFYTDRAEIPGNYTGKVGITAYKNIFPFNILYG